MAPQKGGDRSRGESLPHEKLEDARVLGRRVDLPVAAQLLLERPGDQRPFIDLAERLSERDVIGSP